MMGDPGHIVSHAGRVRYFSADVCPRAYLLDDIFLDAKLAAVEDLDLQAALRPDVNSLAQFMNPW